MTNEDKDELKQLIREALIDPDFLKAFAKAFVNQPTEPFMPMASTVEKLCTLPPEGFVISYSAVKVDEKGCSVERKDY